MFVEQWMTHNPVTMPPQTTISAAALQMSRHKFRHLLVAEQTSKGKKLVGLLSKYDIARAFPANYNPFSVEVAEDTVPQPISTIMVRHVVTVDSSCAIEDAARIFRVRRINALPVMRIGNLVGIITETDVFNAVLDMTFANGHGIKLVVESDDVRTALTLVGQLADQHRIDILGAMSFHNPKMVNKVLSAFQFSSRPSEQFIQQLCTHGLRIVKFG
jgi:acetoin utilization protein AcuB